MNHSLKVLVHKVMTKKDEGTIDENYERAEVKFIQHFNTALQLLSSLESYVSALNKMGSMSKEFGGALTAYYQANDNPQPQGVANFNTAVTAVERTTRTLATKELRDQVLVEWTEYCGFLQTLFNKIAERKQLLQDFDYYKKKVRDLREKPSRDETSLPRNESKLYNAETAYNTLNQELIDVYTSVSSDCQGAFNALFQKVLASTATIHAENGRATASLHEIVADPAPYGCELKDAKYKPLKTHYGTSAVDPAKMKRVLPVRSGDVTPISSSATSTPSASAFSTTASPAVPAMPSVDAVPAGNRRRVRGVYDFEATNEDELSFRVGDVLLVIEEAEEGWWLVEKDGKRGMIPFNYVELI